VGGEGRTTFVNLCRGSVLVAWYKNRINGKGGIGGGRNWEKLAASMDPSEKNLLVEGNDCGACYERLKKSK